MQISTSRYRNSRAISASTAVPVRTSIGAPETPYIYQAVLELAPNRSWLNLTFDRYEPLYIARLEKLGVEPIHTLLLEVGQGRDVVLLCYENLMVPGTWCHRRIFAAWWEGQTGHPVPELPDQYRPRPKPQPSLFGGMEGTVSNAVREKAMRLIREKKIIRTSWGWEVAGDSGITHKVRAEGPAMLPVYCSCPTSMGIICSHRFAAYLLDPSGGLE